MDYTSIPTHQLADETLDRAKEVGNINSAVWSAAPSAFLGIFIGTAVAVFGGAWGYSINPLMAVGFVVLGVGVFYKIARPWFSALKKCNNFAKEMDARRRELEAREAR